MLPQVVNWLTKEQARGPHPTFQELKVQLQVVYWGRRVAVLKQEVDDHALACLVICIYASIGKSRSYSASLSSEGNGFWSHYDALLELNPVRFDLAFSLHQFRPGCNSSLAHVPKVGFRPTQKRPKLTLCKICDSVSIIDRREYARLLLRTKLSTRQQVRGGVREEGGC
jgi:hypothetical protein